MNLQTILEIGDPKSFKIHLANWNGISQPLDVFVRDRAEWHDWNRWRAEKDDFNRRYILALIDFYPDPGHWLFGGIYEVMARGSDRNAHSYDSRLTGLGTELIGRLKLQFARPGRAKALRLENYIEHMIVAELFKEPYSGQPFPGYENVNYSFSSLETIFRSQRPDWKAALLNVKGVYVIFDRLSGRKYVGSAYGATGVWSRWAIYMGTGHGYNDELTRLIEVHGMAYAREISRCVYSSIARQG